MDPITPPASTTPAIPSLQGPDAGASCSLTGDFDLLVEFGVDDADPRVRQVAAAFALTLVGTISGTRFNGAYFVPVDADGAELDDPVLDQHPIRIAVRSIGVDDPGELLGGVASGLTNTLQQAASQAGLVAHVAVTRPDNA